MKSVTADILDFQFGFNTAAVLNLQKISDDPNGRSTYQFVVMNQGLVTDTFAASGRTQFIDLCPECAPTFQHPTAAFFLPDAEVVGNVFGQSVDFGSLFCISGACDTAFDLTPFSALIHSANAAGFDPVYFADAANDFVVAEPSIDHSFVSHTASQTDPGTTFVLNEALYDQLTAPVPEPTPTSLLPVTWFGLLALKRRRTALAST